MNYKSLSKNQRSEQMKTYTFKELQIIDRARAVEVFGGCAFELEYKERPHEELFGADEDCDHLTASSFYSGGGLKCIRCSGWFCY